jgi:hypothetical protein
MSVRPSTPGVMPQRAASHPAVTSFTASVATAIVTTADGAPGNTTVMPWIEKNAAQPASAIAAARAATATPAFTVSWATATEAVTGATGGSGVTVVTGSFFPSR